jgi:hypothetical protein
VLGRLCLITLLCGFPGCAFDRSGVPPDTDGGVMTPVFPAADGQPGGFLPLPPHQPGVPHSDAVGPPITATPIPASGEVTICHVTSSTPKTIQVDLPAVNAHLAHGDHLGPCP